VIVRPPAVYGPRDKDFLALFQAADRGLLPLVGPAERRLSLIHVEDLAAGMLAAGRAKETLHRAWFVTSDPPVTQAELAEGVSVAVGRRPRRLGLPASAARLLGTLADLGAQLTGIPPLLTRERVREVGEGDWICSGAALERASGWRASIALAPGLAATARWYRGEGQLR
jgi:nucleoside-diphosphate-sugar epimerase